MPGWGEEAWGEFPWGGSTGTPLSILTDSLPNGEVGTAYTQTLAATGGTTPYTWSLQSGSLPTGLSMSSAGVISGTPSVSEIATFTVRVTDNVAAHVDKIFSATIVNPPLPVTIVTTSLPYGVIGIDFAANAEATGGTEPYTWSVAVGPVPPGLRFDIHGRLRGIPTEIGSFPFTVQVNDAVVGVDTQVLTLIVAGTTPDYRQIVSVEPSLPIVRPGREFSVRVTLEQAFAQDTPLIFTSTSPGITFPPDAAVMAGKTYADVIGTVDVDAVPTAVIIEVSHP